MRAVVSGDRAEAPAGLGRRDPLPGGVRVRGAVEGGFPAQTQTSAFVKYPSLFTACISCWRPRLAGGYGGGTGARARAQRRFCEKQLLNDKTKRVLERSMGAALTDRYMREVLFDVTANTPTGKEREVFGIADQKVLMTDTLITRRKRGRGARQFEDRIARFSAFERAPTSSLRMVRFARSRRPRQLLNLLRGLSMAASPEDAPPIALDAAAFVFVLAPPAITLAAPPSYPGIACAVTPAAAIA